MEQGLTLATPGWKATDRETTCASGAVHVASLWSRLTARSVLPKKCATPVSGGNHRLPLWGNTSPIKWLMVAKCGYAAGVAFDNG